MSDEQEIAKLVPELVTSLNSITSAATISDLDDSLTTQTIGSSSKTATAATVGVGSRAIATSNHLSEHSYTEELPDTESYRASQTTDKLIDSTRPDSPS